ncbi:MAG: UDP-N-acetylmuramoyl-L-alanyl-D-glutamate--2,6-diaminopimelate ligase [Bacteroidetes bacterium]|nr:UDP-N-acetylmuramoyl-L-alanyl-D-glutamate--2,6-diaminopimelate ligase [Bacteroidota bacterium]
MMALSNILPQNAKVNGNASIQIEGITLDSRAVKPGFLFAAIAGTQVDGHQFIAAAIEKGAAAVLCNEIPADYSDKTTFIQVEDTSQALGEMASAFYGNPSASLKVIAITGTNGKTTTATILKNSLSYLGYRTGLISTVQIEIDDQIIPATHTTPDAVSLQATLAQMKKAGCQYVVMEASSHAIHQKRIAGLIVAGAVFTNITHDHLDYHETFANYINAKKALFDSLPAKAFALTNIDDRNGAVMLQNCSAKKCRYSLKKLADYKCKILEQDFTGMNLDINGTELYVQLSGTFNAYNLTAAFGVLVELGVAKTDAYLAISQAKGAEGRLDWIQGNNQVVGIVDYAHTPDALQNVLVTIGQMNTRNGQIITVVGCGGNRDKAKRPEMAKIAAEHSNRIILTSDNPRNEDPDTIISEMEAGIPLHKRMNSLTISDRKSAIKTACQLAQKGDLVLVAGKGHEKYQEIKGEKFPFDDMALLKTFLTSN